MFATVMLRLTLGVGLLTGCLIALTLRVAPELPASQIVFTSERDGDSEIYLLDLPTRHSQRLVQRAEHDDLMPNWSPNGQFIAFESDRESNGEIYVIRVEDRHILRLTHSLTNNMSPDWSPDGRHLMYFNEFGDIMVMNVMNSHEIRLAERSTTYDSAGPVWSPDGLQIAFQSTRDGNTEIYRMQTDSGEIVRLTDNTEADYTPEWSPDGRWIAFVSERDLNPELYIMDVDGGNARRLTFDPGGDYHPDWSPDGEWIVFNSDRGGDQELYALHVATEKLIRLTFSEGDDWFPAWRP